MAQKTKKNHKIKEEKIEVAEDLAQSDGRINRYINKVKSNITRRRIIFVVILLAVIGGVFFYRSQKAKNGLETTTVQKGTVKEELILSGDVQAEKYVKMTFPVGGKVAWVGVKEGDKVYQGQALSSIDATTLDAAYQQARATLRKYEATVDYIHDSLKDKSTTETYAERDTRTTAEATKDAAYDAFRAAEYNLKNATLIAPFAGIVTSIGQTSPGVNILATETQIELLDPETIYFSVTADQSEVVDIRVGQKALIILDSFSDKELEGEVSYIGYTPKEGETSIVYEIKISFPQKDLDTTKLKISMTGDAKFILSQKDETLFVPNNFVNSDKNGKFVYLGSKKNKVYVETGLEGEENIEITKGVKEGDKLVD
jgi:RND family efflux transporter MFP subunit